MIKCPRCQSDQIDSVKRGFSTTNAITGTLITGKKRIGYLAGTINRNEKRMSCLSCGWHFNEGSDYDSLQVKKKLHNEQLRSPMAWVSAGLVILFMIWILKSCSL